MMARTIADRLKRVSEGHRIPLGKLNELNTELEVTYRKLTDMLADLENARDALDECTDELLDTETPNDERGGLWEAAATASDEAMQALAAFEAWTVGGSGEPRPPAARDESPDEALDRERWRRHEGPGLLRPAE